MAESRRMEFKTIRENGTDVKKKSAGPTQRFTLELFPSTDTKCPEFSFTDLLKKAVTQKSGDKELPGDPFHKDDQYEVAEIARRLEEKYGTKRVRSRHRGDYLKDLVDRGDGYDATDNFIDDTEAYDELVPAELTTKLGGFYINSGKLEFKYISDESVADFQENGSEPHLKKKRANVIDSDSELDDDFQETPKKPKKRKLKDGIDGEKKKRKKILSGDGEKVKRGRKSLDKEKLKKKKASPTVAELLKQQRSTPTPVGPNASTGDRPDGVFDREGVEGTQDESFSQDGDEERNTSQHDSSPVALPGSLPPNLHDVIQKIKRTAMESSEGKCKFFSNSVNQMLLDIENGTRQLTCGNRSQIYAHLANFLPCSKETLLKRAKNLRLNQQSEKLRGPIKKLKEAINNVMPGLQDMHEAECQLAALARTEIKQKDEEMKMEEVQGSTESDEEEKSAAEGGTKKRIMGPRKKFTWDDEIRALLCEVVRTKMKTFEMSKLRNQSAEEYLKAFLDAEIKPLWPPGWMQTRMLFKESRAAHNQWTNPKPRKQLHLTPKTPASPTHSVNSGVTSQPQSNNNSVAASSTGQHGRISPMATVEVVEIADSSDPDDSPVKVPGGSGFEEEKPLEWGARDGDTLPQSGLGERMQGSQSGVGAEERQEGRRNLVTGLLQGSLVQSGAGTFVKHDGLSSSQGASPMGRQDKHQTFHSEFERHVASQAGAAEDVLLGSPKSGIGLPQVAKQGSSSSMQQQMIQQQLQQQQLQQQQLQQQEKSRMQKQKLLKQQQQQQQQLLKLQQQQQAQQQAQQLAQQQQAARQHLTSQQQQLASELRTSQDSHLNELHKQLLNQSGQQMGVPLKTTGGLGTLGLTQPGVGSKGQSVQAKPRLSLDSQAIRREPKTKASVARDEILARIQRDLLVEGNMEGYMDIQMQMSQTGSKSVSGNSLPQLSIPQTQAGKGQLGSAAVVTSHQGLTQPRSAHSSSSSSSSQHRPSAADIIMQSISKLQTSPAVPQAFPTSAPPQPHKVVISFTPPKSQPQRPASFQTPMSAGSGAKGMVSLLDTGNRAWPAQGAAKPQDEVFNHVLDYFQGGRPTTTPTTPTQDSSGRKSQGRPPNLTLTPGSAQGQTAPRRPNMAQPRGPGLHPTPSPGGSLSSPRAVVPPKSGGTAMHGALSSQVTSPGLQQSSYLLPGASGSHQALLDSSKPSSSAGAPASQASPFSPQSLPGLPYWRLYSPDSSKSPHGQ